MKTSGAKASRAAVSSLLSSAGALSIFLSCLMLTSPAAAADQPSTDAAPKIAKPTPSKEPQKAPKDPKAASTEKDAEKEESFAIGNLLMKFAKPQMACRTRAGATVVNLLGNEDIDKLGRERMLQFAMNSCSLLETESAMEVVGMIPSEGIIEVKLLGSDGAPVYIPINSLKEDEMAMALRVDPNLAKELGLALSKLPGVDRKSQKAPKSSSPFKDETPKDLKKDADPVRILRI